MRKSTTIRLWLSFIALIVLGFWFISRMALEHGALIEKINQDCAKNISYSSTWLPDLAKYNINPKDEGLPEYYCQCVIGKPLSALSDQEMNAFIDMNADEKMAQLGGKQGMQERHHQCLEDWATKH